MTPQRTIAKIDRYEPVVQLDRTLPSEGKDRWFESNRVRHIKTTESEKPRSFFVVLRL